MTIHKQMTRNKQAGYASTRRFARDSAQAHVQPGTIVQHVSNGICIFQEHACTFQEPFKHKYKTLSKVASDGLA